MDTEKENEALRKRVAELQEYIKNYLIEGANVMAMDPETIRILAKLGFLVIADLIKGDEDSSELEDKIAKANTEEELKEIAADEAKKVLAAEIGDEEVASVITDLVMADSVERVKDVIAKKEGVLKGLANLIGGLLKAIFG